MADTKRRAKNTEPRQETDSGPAAGRQTRVTLTKDVSSKYRKIMPKSPSSKPRTPGRPRTSSDGSQPPSRPTRPRTGPPRDRAGSEAPRTRPSRPAGEGYESEGRRPYGEGRAPATRRPFGEGRAPAARRPFGEGRAPAARRPFGEGRAPATRRPPLKTGPRRAPGPGGSGEVEMKAIVNRELPEAAKQVREIQDLILNSATTLLTLAESLDSCHQRLDQTLVEVLADHDHLEEQLRPLSEEMAKAKGIVVSLFEALSFQDLTGQRLAKVEHFCQALTQVLSKPVPRPFRQDYASGDKGASKPRYPRSPKAEGGREKPSRLKGPQAEGEGMDQSEIDRLMENL